MIAPVVADVQTAAAYGAANQYEVEPAVQTVWTKAEAHYYTLVPKHEVQAPLAAKKYAGLHPKLVFASALKHESE